MTDEAKALVERLRWSHWYYEDAGKNTSYTSEAPLEAADLIETQAREIERLRKALDWMGYTEPGVVDAIRMRVARTVFGEQP
jgi:hypothetical protein